MILQLALLLSVVGASDCSSHSTLDDCMDDNLCYYDIGDSSVCVDRTDCAAITVDADCMDEDQCLWDGTACNLFEPTADHEDPCECIDDNSVIPSQKRKFFDEDYGKSCAAWDLSKRWCKKKQLEQWPNMCWCTMEWCYVSKECHSARPSDFFEGTTLYFSYSACGDPRGDDCYDQSIQETPLCEGDGCEDEESGLACSADCPDMGNCDVCTGSKGTPGACCTKDEEHELPECFAATKFTVDTTDYAQCVILDKKCEDIEVMGQQSKRTCTANPSCKRNRHNCVKADADLACEAIKGFRNCFDKGCLYEHKEGVSNVCRERTDEDNVCGATTRGSCTQYGCTWKGGKVGCAEVVPGGENEDPCRQHVSHNDCKAHREEHKCVFDNNTNDCWNPCFGVDNAGAFEDFLAKYDQMVAAPSKENCESVGMKYKPGRKTCIGAPKCDVVGKTEQDCCKFPGCKWKFSPKARGRTPGFMCRGEVDMAP